MSQYSHDPQKFKDAGLQLRLPVDLVPSGQYSRLTNLLPVIEGEIVARDGMTSLGAVTTTSFVYLLSGLSGLNTAATVYPHGLVNSVSATLIVIFMGPTATSNIVGTYAVTVASTPTPTTFTFTPAITVGAGVTAASVFAEVIGPSVINSLIQTQITNIFRLSQAVAALPTERLVMTNGRVYQSSLSTGLQWEEIVGPISPGSPIPSTTMGFGGGPMAVIGFRFTLDSASWSIFCDGFQMWKYRPGISESAIELVPLGNAAPTAVASATAGGVGNLDSSGGTGYDWRYTYVDGLALTEGNPSPINMSSGGTITTRPTAFTNPAVVGDQLFDNPNYAIDTDPTTAATGSAESLSSIGSATQSVDCAWTTWNPAAGAVTAITLNVLASLSVTVGGSGGTAVATATLLYSYDAGNTFQSLARIEQVTVGTTSTGQQTYTATIPSAASLSNIILKAVGYTLATGTTHAGEPGTGIASVAISVYDINTSVTESGSTNVLNLTNQSANVCVTPSPYPQHTFINLYRRGGSLPDAWRLVGQSQVSSLSAGSCGGGMLLINDNVSDTTLSTSTILLLDNNQPVSSVTVQVQPLAFIWGPVGYDVRVLGCGDPARPESVYFSKPGNADSWPPENYVEVSQPGTPIIAGCAFNTRNFAFSREAIYELIEGLGTGATFTPFRTPSAHGLFSPWALAVGPAMFFVAKDGVYMSTGGQETSIVENDIKPLFPTYDTPGQSVNGYEAVDMTQPNAMRLTYHNDELYFVYAGATTGTQQILVYDLLKKRWRAMSTSCGVSEIYSEPNTVSSLLYGTNAGVVYQAGGTADPTELDIIASAGITTIAAATSFTSGTFYARLVRYTSAGAVAISYEAALTLSATVGVQVVIPQPPAGTLYWRLFLGSMAGAEANYTQFTEPLASRTIVITALGTAGTLPTTNASNAIACLLRTGAHDQGAPLNQKQYGNVLMDLNPGAATSTSPVTITPYINGEVHAESALTVTGTGRQQVPLDLSDFFAFNTEYEVSWSQTALVSPTLFQYDTLWFAEPVQVTHWQAQPTSFSFPGFMHVRDCYIAIRSTSTVTLTVIVDSVLTLTYVLPSTNNQRLKQYIQLDSNKGLMYQFSLDATASFRVYEEDLEIRVKPWLGVLGYQPMRILGGENAGASGGGE